MARQLPQLSFHKTKHRRRLGIPNPAKLLISVVLVLCSIVLFLFVCLVFQ